MNMVDPTRILYIHGSESSSQTFKAQYLRSRFPDMITPDFSDLVPERLSELNAIIGETNEWTLIGSSLGGMVATIYADRYPERVRKLILLAPALNLPEFEIQVRQPIRVPAVIVHGTLDRIVPPGPVRKMAERVFPKLTYIVVEDDHRLHEAIRDLDWQTLLD
ncbi:MAG: alpha/beta fold hydrolase [Anaerolineales bacterium]|nr:alpha/beta fold hydrolase [Anaerolineales bacterium]